MSEQGDKLAVLLVASTTETSERCDKLAVNQRLYQSRRANTAVNVQFAKNSSGRDRNENDKLKLCTNLLDGFCEQSKEIAVWYVLEALDYQSI